VKVILVGLTGGIASGKSTVSALFREEGAFIIDADKISHELIRKGGKAYELVVSVFGKAILEPSEEIDRKKLGSIVFSHPAQCERLNKIIHPLVFEKLNAEKHRISLEHPQSVIVFDAPLLIEAKAHKKMDWVLLVYADREVQLDRLKRRDGLTRTEAERRISTQLPIDEKIPLVDEVLDNRELLPEIKKKVHEIYLRLLEKAIIL